MNDFNKQLQVRWSDLDPNFHLRHSVYYDWGAFCRVEFMNACGLTAEVMQQLKVGPILFREECVFRKEIKLGDEVAINLKLIKGRKDFSRWSIQHQIIKQQSIVAATLTVEGAWMNVVERKLSTPPAQVYEVFNKMPKAEELEWI